MEDMLKILRVKLPNLSNMDIELIRSVFLNYLAKMEEKQPHSSPLKQIISPKRKYKKRIVSRIDLLKELDFLKSAPSRNPITRHKSMEEKIR